MPVAEGLCDPWTVTASGQSTTAQRAALLVRDPGERLLAGVATAASRRLGVDVMFIRVGFAALSLAGGVGVLAYLLLWALTPETAGGDTRPAPDPNLQRAAAFGLQMLGAMLVLRSAGLWLGDALVWPLALAALGSAVLWARSDDAGRASWTALASSGKPLVALLSDDGSLPRRLIGGALVLSALFALLVTNVRADDLAATIAAFIVAVGGLALLLAPAVYRLAQQAGEERRERIRSEERAEIGAHLHDSVLHTLALIQRSESPQEMATLARSQERELRTWLQGRPTSGEDATVESGFEAMAARMEAGEHIAVDLVVVGDAPLDQQLTALVAAAGEAVTNAARHAGVGEVSVYVEVEATGVTVYIRDEGKGFDPTTVAPDRRGIAHSIRGRMERHGGSAAVDTRPGEGTEVTLTMPRKTP